jgi:hypothetical protein
MGLETKHKSLYYVFVGVYVNLCTVAVIELIVFSYNEGIVQLAFLTPPFLGGIWAEVCEISPHNSDFL